MPLVPSVLASSLQSSWLAQEGGSFASSPAESGDRFATAVSNWFALAMAGPFPCATATARKSQLAAAATAALQAGDASLAGQQLALGLVGYLAGQAFGAGIASAPTAAAAAQLAIVSVFTNLDLSVAARADQIATGAHTLAISTMVIFPPVISPPVPVL